MLNCPECTRNLSAYLDYQMDEAARAEIGFHLRICPVCQRRAHELDSVRQALTGLTDRPVSQDDTRQWIAALSQAARQTPREKFKRIDWDAIAQAVRPIAAAYATGFMVTCALFIGILFSFRPIARWTAAPSYEVVYLNSQDLSRIAASSSSTTSSTAVGYTRPSIEQYGGLENLHDALFLTDDRGDGLVFIAEVSSEGKAQLVRMLDGNPRMAERVNAALLRSSFQPAREFGHPVRSQVVLMMEQIRVRG